MSGKQQRRIGGRLDSLGRYARAGHVGIEEEPRRREEMPHLDVAPLQIQACDRLHMNVGSRQCAARALCKL
jgi:hypothetical protein